MRRLFHWLAAATMITVAALVPVTRADAHAVLRSSEPADRQVLPTAPDTVVLHFSESVTLSPDSVKLLDDRGRAVVKKGAEHLRGEDDTVVLRLPELDDDAYVVTWRVISADAHPAAGAYTFRVGAGDQDFHVGAGLLQPESGSRVVGVAFGVARFALFSSLLALAGGLAFLLFLWPVGLNRPRPRALLRAAWWTALVSTVATVMLQGPYGQGQGLAGAVSPSTLSIVLGSRYGQAGVVRLVLLGLLWLAVMPSRSGHKHVAVGGNRRLGVALVVVAVLATVAAAGHAATGRFVALAFTADVIHLVSLSLWLGGLAMLVVYLFDGGPTREMALVLPRFSTMAFGSVVAIVVTGTFQSWRQLDGVGDLTTTTFGRLLLAKLVLVAFLLGLGGLSRRRLRAHYRMPAVPVSVGPGAAAADVDHDLAKRLRRSVGAEVFVALAVLSLTAMLVNAVPGRSVAKSVEAIPFSTEMVKDAVKVGLTVEPARAGLNDIHVYTFSLDGVPKEPLEVTATLSLAAGGASNIKVPMVKSGAGHYSAFGFPIPISGTWQVDVAVLVSEFEEVRVTASVPVS